MTSDASWLSLQPVVGFVAESQRQPYWYLTMQTFKLVKRLRIFLPDDCCGECMHDLIYRHIHVQIQYYPVIFILLFSSLQMSKVQLTLRCGSARIEVWRRTHSANACPPRKSRRCSRSSATDNCTAGACCLDFLLKFSVCVPISFSFYFRFLSIRVLSQDADKHVLSLCEVEVYSH